MDRLTLDIIETERTITRCAIQVKQLDRRLNEIQTRYEEAEKQNQLLWTYKLRMRTLTVEGVKNVFMRLLLKKMAMLEDLRELQYWEEVEAMGLLSESETDSEEDTTFRIIGYASPAPRGIGIIPEGHNLMSIDEFLNDDSSGEDEESDSSFRIIATGPGTLNLDIEPEDGNWISIDEDFLSADSTRRNPDA